MELLHPSLFPGLSEDACIKIQKALAPKVIQRNGFQMDSLRSVAGVDIAYWMDSGIEWAVCCIVVIGWPAREIVETQYSAGQVKFPYIPGCFAFRELPLVLETAAKLKQKPDIFLFDGNGILHPRSMGLATHASFYLEAPTVGIAKKFFHAGEFIMPGNTPGDYSDITRDGKILGRAIRTKRDVKPVFASVGNYVDIDTVTRLTVMFTDSESHIPIPTRYADLETHIKRRELREQNI